MNKMTEDQKSRKSSQSSESATLLTPSLTEWLKQNKINNSNNLTSNRFLIPDEIRMKELRSQKNRPWTKDPHYFTKVYVSATAILKMIMHAKTGYIDNNNNNSNTTTNNNNSPENTNTWIEVMGILQGHFTDNTIIITDAFALPVTANEVECLMTDSTMSYMTNYQDDCSDIGKISSCVAWYHSHPGYSCFLSGTDVGTQRASQPFQEPWVAFVIDPIRSLSLGRVDIKAFRTYPEGFVDEYNNNKNKIIKKKIMMDAGVNIDGDLEDCVPEDKLRDVGYYINHYYEVPIIPFRSESDGVVLERLWACFWSKTFTNSCLIETRQFTDRRVATMLSRFTGGVFSIEEEEDNNNILVSDNNNLFNNINNNSELDPFKSISRLNDAIGMDVVQGLFIAQVKEDIFNSGFK